MQKTDAELAYYLSEELDSNLMEEVETLYPETKYAELVPVDSSDGEGAETVGYYQIDKTGMSEIIADGASDSPAVDLHATKITLPVHESGNHVSYTYRELRNAEAAKRNGVTRDRLDSARLLTAAQVTEQHMDDICILADKTKDKRFAGMQGLVHHENFTKIGGIDFTTLTDDEIIAEFAKMHRQIVKDTKGVWRGNTFAMSDDTLAYLATRRLGDNESTLLSFLKKTFEGYSFITHWKLSSDEVLKNPATGVAGNFECIICYARTPQVLRFKMPMKWRTYQPVPEGRAERVETAATTAGVEARQPLAVVVYYYEV